MKMLHDYVLLDPLPEDKMIGSIAVPEDIDKTAPRKALVVAAGQGEWEKGKLHPMCCKRGDLVVYLPTNFTYVKEDDQEFILTKASEVLAILRAAPDETKPTYYLYNGDGTFRVADPQP
jgi:chaperonin GroES